MKLFTSNVKHVKLASIARANTGRDQFNRFGDRNSTDIIYWHLLAGSVAVLSTPHY